MDKHLIIFVTTPSINEKDKNEQLKAYLSSMEHTAAITSSISASKHIYYDKHIENDSFFNDEFFQKKIHQTTLPKQQVSNALRESFGQWAKKVVFMNSNNIHISQKDIELVFYQLNYSEFVILPKEKDGILIFGTTFFSSDLLNYFPWKTEDDLLDTIISLQKSNRSYCVLATKNDS
tara:strand:- start:3482 stop:4012 length:531 start_codon:yes stop_codon:yes gene_type:complete